MYCKDFNDQLIEYTNFQELSSEMKSHLNSCSACAESAEEYFFTLSMLKPKIQPNVDANLKDLVINQLKTKKMEPKNKKRPIIQVLKIAAIIVVVFATGLFLSLYFKPSFISTTYAAENIFKKSIDALNKVNSMIIKMNIRTIEGDNFELIGSEYDFVENTITKQFTPDTKWKIEKPGRTVVFNGENQFLLVKKAFAIKGGKNSGFVEWMQRLLNPALLYEKEIRNAQECADSKYSVDKSSNDIVLTINTKAKGNFENAYLRNSSIEESDCRIVYTFTKADYLLKDLQVFIIDKGVEILILDVVGIKYNEVIPSSQFEISLPVGLEWQDATKKDEIKKSEFINITSKQAAEIFFKACESKDWKRLKDTYPYMNDDIKNYLGGLKLISLGESFKSGMYPGEFVPYKIKLNDGSEKEMNIAIRNDNPSKIWMIDGGI